MSAYLPMTQWHEAKLLPILKVRRWDHLFTFILRIPRDGSWQCYFFVCWFPSSLMTMMHHQASRETSPMHECSFRSRQKSWLSFSFETSPHSTVAEHLKSRQHLKTCLNQVASLGGLVGVRLLGLSDNQTRKKERKKECILQMVHTPLTHFQELNIFVF